MATLLLASFNNGRVRFVAEYDEKTLVVTALRCDQDDAEAVKKTASSRLTTSNTQVAAIGRTDESVDRKTIDSGLKIIRDEKTGELTFPYTVQCEYPAVPKPSLSTERG